MSGNNKKANSNAQAAPQVLSQELWIEKKTQCSQKSNWYVLMLNVNKKTRLCLLSNLWNINAMSNLANALNFVVKICNPKKMDLNITMPALIRKSNALIAQTLSN
jgi:hypothetical protein